MWEFCIFQPKTNFQSKYLDLSEAPLSRVSSVSTFPYLPTRIHLAGGSDHPGHTLPGFHTFLLSTGRMAREGSLAHPKASHRTASWTPRRGLLGKHALFGSDVQPWDRAPPSRQMVLWSQDTYLGCIACAWLGLLMDLERDVCSRTRWAEDTSPHHLLTAMSAWQSNPPLPAARWELESCLPRRS